MSKKKHKHKNKKYEKKGDTKYLTMDDVISEKHDAAMDEIMRLQKKIKKKKRKKIKTINKKKGDKNNVGCI